MAYVALYRKYRSQSFGELMGQEAVTTTLQNAIRSNHIAHAYLFYGARGCGKTSTARLLARALNCVAQDGPTPEPCGKCRLCTSIRDGNCLDVVEIDAASETSIDDVREKIIENVQYAPAEGRYKVYIIDEVHDLSAKAFDALLKTLEEPPGHVIFILATTEWHKVPITIRSRCQQFAFKRGTLQDLAASVQKVLDKEGYTAEPEAVLAVARSAEGSWRDALSLLEQVLAYSDRHVTAATVHRAIGTVGAEMLARVTETLLLGRWDLTLGIAGELIESGTDARQLLVALNGHLRDMMLISAGAKETAAKELGPDRLAFLTPQAAQFDPPTLLAMMTVLSNAEREIRFTNQHRWLLESTLLRLMPASLQALPAQASLAKPIPQGEIASARSQAPPSASATPAAVPRPPTPTVVARLETALVEEPSEESDLEDEEIEVEIEMPLPSVSAQGNVATAFPAPVATPPQRTGTSQPESPQATNTDRFATAVNLDVIRKAWPRMLKAFARTSPQGYPWLEKAEVMDLQGNVVILGFKDGFARDRIQNNAKGRALVEKTLNEVLNTEGYKIRCELLRKDDGQEGGGAASPNKPGPTAPAPPEMATLLDAPVNAPPAPTRIADFEMPTMPPPSPTQNGHSASSNAVAPPMMTATPAPAPLEKPASNGLLVEALDIFGGEVIRTELIP